MLTNEVQKLDLDASSSLLFEWLANARDGTEDILFVIGAGLSMTGYNVAPSGWDVAQKYESFLRAKGKDIPESISKDIAKLYEYFCYPEINGIKEFSTQEHEDFINNITTNSEQHRFNGTPNFQHRSLINEVQETNGNIRIYSLNLDSFFEAAELNADTIENNIINVTNLLDKSSHDNIFRDWRILAAHGKNNATERSVWSESLLTSSVLSEDLFPDHLKDELELLQKALMCIEKGPSFSKVIFVGLAAPLTYLMTSLKDKVQDDFKWAWINPYTPPKEWVYNDTDELFNNENGYWFENSLDDLLWLSQAKFYERWFSTSCDKNQSDILLLNKYQQNDFKQPFVESVYRARRIYDIGVKKLLTANSNFESINVLNDNKHVYKYPILDHSYRYYDSNLGFALHKLFIKDIKLLKSSGDFTPSLTVAGTLPNNNPISAHIFKFDPTVPDDKVANGIAMTFDGVEIAVTHRHIIIIDVRNYYIENLIKAIQRALKKRFPNDFKFTEVIKFDELDIFLNNRDFTKPPQRARRP